ncbi:MAG: protein translocase subunit SecD, partial [Candidatus Regiella insecticola]|nr:protein translocase subunit SecD [Candidatus Regiella insecticola]
IDSLRADLRQKNISYLSAAKQDQTNYGVVIRFADDKLRDTAISYLSSRHRDLVINTDGNNELKALMSDERLREARGYALQKNITILRNRVNQLGL